jgi:hypothetical protein
LKLYFRYRTLGNLDWQIGLDRSEIAQLELLGNPPAQDRGPRYEVVKRPAGLDVCSDDNIVFPGKPPDDAA